MIVCPKEYQTSDWGNQSSVSDVWEGPMDELVAYQEEIKADYTTTQITPTKGGHGRLVATITAGDGGPPAPPEGDLTIEVEWVELRLPVETNPAFSALSKPSKSLIRNYAAEGKLFSEIPMSFIDSELAEKLFNLIAGGTTEYSTGVPVVRQTTKNASAISHGWAWYRDTPPVSIPRGGSGETWEWLKTTDRRVKVGNDITQIEEWTGSVEWDADLYP